MPDYQQGKIYKIECNVTGKVYIGSTCEPILARRLTGHRENYKCYLNGKSHYISSFDVLQNGNYDIVLIESYPCNSKDELHSRERYHTNNIDCVNKIKCQGMKNELGKKGYDKYNYEKNKDIIHAKKKEYYNDNKNKIIEKSKAYHEKNKDIIRDQQKEYYKQNKDKLKEIHNCMCGGKYTHINKIQHLKSKKHLYYLKHKTIIDGLNMIKALDKYFNTI
jgi:hypothetical protein